MVIISDDLSFNRYSAEIKSFISLYESSFPDPDEREDFDIIATRITNNTYHDDPKTFLVITGDAGLVVEYYNSCGSILLTYIVVGSKSRRRGLAKTLLMEGVSEVISLIKVNTGTEVNNIFFEANNPGMTDLDSFDPDLRLKIFKKLGAKYIDISYVQPPLGPGKNKVRNLFLLCLPRKDKLLEFIRSETILNFLTSFYIELGIENPGDDPDFIKMRDEILSKERDGLFFLGEIPLKYDEKLKFHKSAVSFHIPLSLKSYSPVSCPFIRSYELDLFSYLNQDQVPFQSNCLRPYDPLMVKIRLPDYIKYVSEGRTETIISNKREINAKVFPLITSFKGGYGVATLTFNPADWFSEIELTGLTSLFGSRQEDSNIKETIRFSANGNEYTIDQLFDLIFSGFSSLDPCYKRLTGSVQIDGSSVLYGTEDFDWEKLFELFNGVELENPDCILELQKSYDNHGGTEYILNAFCGILLGIFDFNRMGIDEIIDTLRPINSSSGSFVVFSRGCIGELCYDDSLLEATSSTIGISPYLIIPNIVLTLNEYLLHRASRELEKAFSPEYNRINQIEEILHKSSAITGMTLKDPFQYKSEKTLQQIGYTERNMALRREEIEELRESVTYSLRRLVNKRKERYDTFVSMILIIISVFQLESIIRTLVLFTQGSDQLTEVDLIGMIITSGLIIVAIGFFLAGKMITARAKSDD